jgi:hypothetical protein
VTVLIVQFMPGTATATDSLITTYYWDGAWVEHASWTTTLGEDLNIQILAWNWQPGFPSLHVQFDNVITGDGLLDDFDDGIINDSIWKTSAHISEGVTLEETGGVLDVDIPAGPPSQGNGVCGGATTREYLLHGAFDVQVDFSLNAEFHQAPPYANARLLITDQSEHSVDISLRSGYYFSMDIVGPPGPGHREMAKTPTDHLTGKLRISRTIILVTVEIDIKPGSYPNSINPKSRGVIPVAILTTEDFDAKEVDPSTVALEGVLAKERGKSGKYGSLEDVDADGDLDLVVQIPNTIA